MGSPDVWGQLKRAGGKEFSVRGDTAFEAAKALAVAEGALSAIGGVVGKNGLHFAAEGFGRLPGGKGVELGRKFVDRAEDLGTMLRGHRETVRGMREVYVKAGDLFEVTESDSARRFAIDRPAAYRWRFEGTAKTITAGVFDKGRNSKEHKLEVFDPESAGVRFLGSGVAWVPAEAMTWYQLWDLGRSIRTGPVRAAGQNWIWLAHELRASVEDLKSGLEKAFTGWKGESPKAAVAAYGRFQAELAALHKGMSVMGMELAFAAGWLEGTPYGMPVESAPTKGEENIDSPDEVTGGMNGGGFFLTSLAEFREYYARSYLAGFKISRDRIPQFTPPKVTPRTDPNTKTDPRTRIDPKQKTDPKTTGERPGQRGGGEQQQPGVQRIGQGSKTIQQGVQDVNKGTKTTQEGIAQVGHGTALIEQGRADLARGLVSQGQQNIAQGEAQVKKGQELIERGEREVRTGQQKIKQGQQQITDAEKVLSDTNKHDPHTAQAIKQADQYRNMANQVVAAGEQYVRAGQDAISAADKVLSGGQRIAEVASPQSGPGDTGVQQVAGPQTTGSTGQQTMGSIGQQESAGLPGQPQSSAQDATAALAGIALAAGAFAQAAGQGVQAIIQAGVAAASQMEQLGMPSPDVASSEPRPADPVDVHEPKNSDESKVPNQRHEHGGGAASSPSATEPPADRRTNLFPKSDDPPESLPPAPVIEPLVLPPQEHPLAAAPYAGRSAETEPDGVHDGGSFVYSAAHSGEPVGDGLRVSPTDRPMTRRSQDG
ncbi:hypothetical protein AB0C34_01950 [Nocardia sp. NPDC049220]|uniref:hypothetical protein n=1 Tax=Nocardia sp. NPDC049220 TaxID=3155273 RepID=UPI0033E419E4